VWRFGAAEQLAEKVVEAAKSLPQALKRLLIFNRLAARLKSGPTQNLTQSWFFRSLFSRAPSKLFSSRFSHPFAENAKEWGTLWFIYYAIN